MAGSEAQPGAGPEGMFLNPSHLGFCSCESPSVDSQNVLVLFV